MSSEPPESPPAPKPRRSPAARVVRAAPIGPATRGELTLAALVALVLAALVIGGGLFRGSRAFAPGAREAAIEESSAPRSSATQVAVDGALDLSARRATVAALAAGRLPLWESRVAGGEPWLANPAHSVFDPEVLATAALAGEDVRASVDRATSIGAWLRLALAGLGAYALARRLGTSARAAATCGVGFAGSGLMLGHLAGPLGHATAFAPWILVAVDRLRTAPPARAVALVGLATAALAVSGSPGTTFVVVIFALAFAGASLEGRARAFAAAGLALGLAAAAPAILPFLAALPESHAFALQREAATARGAFDALALGLVIVTAAIVVAWRGLAADEDEAQRARRTVEFGEQMAAAVRGERATSSADAAQAGTPGGTHAGTRAPASPGRVAAKPSNAAKPWTAMLGLAGLLCAVTTCAWIIARRGDAARARAWLLPDAFSRPDVSAVFDLAAFARDGGAWIAAVVVALALASFLSADGPLRARRTIQVTGLVALLLALRVGGAVDAWRWLPFFGLSDAGGAAAVACLCCALLAAEALDAATRPARRAAALVYVSLVGLCLFAAPPESPRFAPDPEDPYFAVTERPPAAWTHGAAQFAGYVTTSLPCDGLTLARVRVDEDGRVIEGGGAGDADVASGETGESETLTLAAADASGRRAFRSRELAPSELEPGTWRFTVTFLRARADAPDETMGTRVVAYARVAREPRIGVVSMASTMGAFLVLLFVAGVRGRATWIAAGLVFVQVFLWSGRLWTDTSPSAGASTAVDRVGRHVAELARGGRVLATESTFPGTTTLDHGLSNAGGGAGFLTSRMADLRAQALRDGAPPGAIERFGPGDVDPRSNALRLLGVTHVVTRAPHPGDGTELVAGPRAGLGADSTVVDLPVCVSKTSAPLPRAFCVTKIVERHRAMSGTAAFDPATEAFLDEGVNLTFERPATRARAAIEPGASHVEGGEHVRVFADVDGDALLVLADAYASGWSATVDGREAPILAVNGALRGVALESGQHVVEFNYRPRTVTIATWLGLVALVSLWILALIPSRRPVE